MIAISEVIRRADEWFKKSRACVYCDLAIGQGLKKDRIVPGI